MARLTAPWVRKTCLTLSDDRVAAPSSASHNCPDFWHTEEYAGMGGGGDWSPQLRRCRHYRYAEWLS